MSLQIVRMTQEHTEEVHRVLDIVARERKFLSYLEAPPLAQSRKFVSEMIAKRNPMCVAVVDDKVVGWCDVVRVERPVHAHVGVLGMGLLPAHRGKGYGTELINAVVEDAHRVGISRIELTVHADNDRAIALYEKVGFVREGVRRDAVCIDGRFIDSILMAKLHHD
jgi:RimJ/RimL family protein N-acetyltransferase